MSQRLILQIIRFHSTMARTKRAARKRHQNRDRDQNQDAGDSRNRTDNRGRPEKYKLTVKRNLNFEEYYSGIGLVPEGEWENFLSVLRNPLPVTFRVTGFRGQSQELLKIVRGKYLNDLMQPKEEKTVATSEPSNEKDSTEQMQTSDGQTESKSENEAKTEEKESKPVVPKCLQWYPDELAWQINLSRNEVRQNVHLQKLKEFLLSETESGNISRQEAVSMIPPLVLDVKPHHKVLDMCAAPGSKTAQIIEYLHATEGNKEPEGYVVANDVDNRRCYLMVHQVKRLQSPCCMIISSDAAVLPNLRFQDDKSNEFVNYDRVLCDVPCSGDGTMRKNCDIWDKWNCKSGNNLHWQQIRILKRGLELATVGGRIVYSTCSFNPVEDEAVINTVLKQCQGSLELVDVSDLLPGLKSVPGLLSWRIMTAQNQWYDTYDEAREAKVKQIAPSMFPPSLSEARERNLDRCIRILPHHQDTGGFFIAVLKKKDYLPWQKPKAPPKQETEQKEGDKKEGTAAEPMETEGTAATSSVDTVDTTGKEGKDAADKDSSTGEKRKHEDDSAENETSGTKKQLTKSQRKLEKKSFGYKEDPFLFFSKTDEVWTPIKEFYDISNDLNCEQILYRTESGKRNTLYYVSAAVRNLVVRNSDRVKFINMGVKAFGRSPSPLVPNCDYRISQEGLGSISSFMPSRSVCLNKKDMLVLLTQENPFLDRLTSCGRDAIRKISPGSMIFKFSPLEGDNEPNCDITVCGWRGKASIRSFVAKQERTHLLRLFGFDLSDILKEQEEEREARKKAEAAISAVTSDVDNDSDIAESDLLKMDNDKVTSSVAQIEKEEIKQDSNSEDMVSNEQPSDT